jgi:hypothetical protein
MSASDAKPELDLDYRNDGPQCPYCGEITRPDEAHFYDEDLSDLTCEHCHEEFAVAAHHMGWKWSTAKRGECP